jgi:hypothetical protein
MADLLATPANLQALPGLSELSTETATALLEIATAVVQDCEEVQQDLVAVVDDTAEIMGTVDSWLDLPQRDVTAIESVTVDGEAVTDFQRYGGRLWRECGWAASPHKPSTVVVVYSHGRAYGHRRLRLAKSAALMLAASQAGGEAGVQQEEIDDYKVVYERMVTVLENATHLRRSLRKRYGRRGGYVRV